MLRDFKQDFASLKMTFGPFLPTFGKSIIYIKGKQSLSLRLVVFWFGWLVFTGEDHAEPGLKKQQTRRDDGYICCHLPALRLGLEVIKTKFSSIPWEFCRKN